MSFFLRVSSAWLLPLLFKEDKRGVSCDCDCGGPANAKLYQQIRAQLQLRTVLLLALCVRFPVLAALATFFHRRCFVL